MERVVAMWAWHFPCQLGPYGGQFAAASKWLAVLALLNHGRRSEGSGGP